MRTISCLSQNAFLHNWNSSSRHSHRSVIKTWRKSSSSFALFQMISSVTGVKSFYGWQVKLISWLCKQILKATYSTDHFGLHSDNIMVPNSVAQPQHQAIIYHWLYKLQGYEQAESVCTWQLTFYKGKLEETRPG